MTADTDHRQAEQPSDLAGARLEVDGDEARRLAERLYGKHGVTQRFATEKDDTFRLTCADGRFVLKIAHPNESLEELDFQVELMRHVASKDPRLPVPRVFPDVDGKLLPHIVTDRGEGRIVRLYSYVEGVPLEKKRSTRELRRSIGDLLGRLRHAMSDFSHPADGREVAWDVTNLMKLRDLIRYIPDDERREQIERVFERFLEIKPVLDASRRQVLHNDFNTSNLVVDEIDTGRVRGVIDFGDAVRTAIAVDVSTALMNLMPYDLSDDGARDMLVEPRDALEGYMKVADLTRDELRLIPFLMIGRLATRALLTCWRAQLFPENSNYILRNTEIGWKHLRWFDSHSTSQIADLLISDRNRHA